MNNVKIIESIGKQIGEVSNRISSLSHEIEETNAASPAICDCYEQFLLDEIGHLQVLVLELTQVATEDEPHEDEGVFSEGELNSVIGEKQEEHPDEH